MGKNKRLKGSTKNTKSTPHKLTRPSSISKTHPSSKNPKSTYFSDPKPSYFSKSSKEAASAPPPKKKNPNLNHLKPTIPFHPSDKILLIGEGDLSFSLSLLEHHKCKSITATTYEQLSELKEKYPHVAENIRKIEELGGVVRYGVDAGKVKEKGWKGMGGMERIVFNFPHVGGKSTDVNRQVRYNQELLVSFFLTSLPSLSPKPGSSIIVTLFEGSPYTLWNIRDLARHAGLEVKESFKFQASAYPGYRHSRTIGVVKGRGGGEDGKEHGWKGEEREARSYVFVRKGEGNVAGVRKGKGAGEESDSSESENEKEVQENILDEVGEEEFDDEEAGEEDDISGEEDDQADQDEEENDG